jgi:hypothetical protein
VLRARQSAVTPMIPNAPVHGPERCAVWWHRGLLVSGPGSAPWSPRARVVDRRVLLRDGVRDTSGDALCFETLCFETLCFETLCFETHEA